MSSLELAACEHSKLLINIIIKNILFTYLTFLKKIIIYTYGQQIKEII
jgi:hypothetical protein